MEERGRIRSLGGWLERSGARGGALSRFLLGQAEKALIDSVAGEAYQMATPGDTVLAVFRARHMLCASILLALDVAPSWSMYGSGMEPEF
jgi:hypothetical protein